MTQAAIDVVLPAHNEEETIGSTLEEFFATVTTMHGIPVRFIVCEDGSTDDTVSVLKETAEKVPLLLISEPQRKGYSRAVVDGFRASESALVGFIDSDGQCDPADFPTLHAAIADADLVVGYRNPRRDHWTRRLMSGAFKVVYSRLFSPSVRDPSCPYLLVRRPALESILDGDVGTLNQGFWWEFVARAHSAGIRIAEVPVNHRVRSGGGSTQIYMPSRVPRIAADHLGALFKLRKELRAKEALRARSER